MTPRGLRREGIAERTDASMSEAASANSFILLPDCIEQTSLLIESLSCNDNLQGFLNHVIRQPVSYGPAARRLPGA